MPHFRRISRSFSGRGAIIQSPMFGSKTRSKKARVLILKMDKIDEKWLHDFWAVGQVSMFFLENTLCSTARAIRSAPRSKSGNTDRIQI